MRPDIVIEGSTATWELRAEGAINGTYAGQFRFRCYLSPTQEIASNREYRDLLGANPTLATEHVSFLAYALTQLKYRIISGPPFWESTKQDSMMSGDIPDHEIITEVLNAAVDAEVKYKEQLKERKIESLERAKAQVQAMLDKQRQDDIDDTTSEETDSKS